MAKYYKYKTIADGYRELKCIIGAKNPVLHTGIYPSSDTMIRMKFKYTVWSGGVFIGYFGEGEQDSFRFFRHNTTTYLDYGSGDGLNRISGTWLSDANAVYEAEIGNRYVKDLRTDTVMFSGSSVSFARKSYPIQIFNTQDYGTIYYYQVFENEVLVQDLVPCERAADGAVGMWDTVTSTFIPAEGTWYKGDYTILPATPEDYDYKVPTAIAQPITKYWKHNYTNNVAITGNLQVDGTKLSGFSTSNFARTIPASLSAYTGTANSWEVQFKIMHVYDGKHHNMYASGISSGGSTFTVLSDNTIELLLQSPAGMVCRFQTAQTLTSGNIYWLKFVFTGSQYQINVSTDGVTFETWGSVNSTAKLQPASADNWRLGVSAQTSYAFPFSSGYIDLADTYIKIEDEYIWQGLQDNPIPATAEDYDFVTTGYECKAIEQLVTKYWKYDYTNNVAITGSLQVDGTKLSGFSTSNFARTIPEDFAYYVSSASNWEVQFKVYHVQNNKYHVLYANGLGYGTLFGITEEGRLDIFVTNSSLSGYSVEMRTSNTLQTNTLYWLKFIFTGTQYLIEVSTDGVDFSTWGTANTSNKVPYRSGAMWRIGVSAQRGYESPFNAGYIDLAESYIKTDGSFLWKGVLDTPAPATPEDYDFTTEGKKYCVL